MNKINLFLLSLAIIFLGFCGFLYIKNQNLKDFYRQKAMYDLRRVTNMSCYQKTQIPNPDFFAHADFNSNEPSSIPPNIAYYEKYVSCYDEYTKASGNNLMAYMLNNETVSSLMVNDPTLNSDNLHHLQEQNRINASKINSGEVMNICEQYMGVFSSFMCQKSDSILAQQKAGKTILNNAYSQIANFEAYKQHQEKMRAIAAIKNPQEKQLELANAKSDEYIIELNVIQNKAKP